jgi:arabinose-5-phosphate isomerase
MNPEFQTSLDVQAIERGLSAARSAIRQEMEAVADLSNRLIPELEPILPLLLSCKGKIVVTGLGKSGHIAGKIAATLSSTGSSSFYVHPTEALHGDSGVLHALDLLVAISYSGETVELCSFARLAQSWNIPIIALTGNKSSTLSRIADSHIDISVLSEADPLGIAPTCSTTVTLIVGDVIASALMAAKNFTLKEFGLRHPGGALGVHLSGVIEDQAR